LERIYGNWKFGLLVKLTSFRELFCKVNSPIESAYNITPTGHFFQGMEAKGLCASKANRLQSNPGTFV
jgi:hypothetical protein